MKILDSRFLHGPNNHLMMPCFAVLLDLEDHRTVGVEELPGAADFLSMLLPGHCAPVLIDATEVARLLARIMFTAQIWAGSHVTFCDLVAIVPSTRQRYRLLCDYQHEAVAEEALHLSLAFLTALLARQPFDLKARLNRLKELAGACLRANGSLCPACYGVEFRRLQRPIEGPVKCIALPGKNNGKNQLIS